MNCEETEKEPTSQPAGSQEHLVASNESRITKVDIDYEQVECVLLTKLQAAVLALQETNSSEMTIHQCHVITACSEAILAVRKLTAAGDTPT